MVEKSHPDGKLEYGKLCLVRHADVQMLLLCIAFFNKSANVPSSKQQSVPSSLTAFKTKLGAKAKQSWQLAASLDAADSAVMAVSDFVEHLEKLGCPQPPQGLPEHAWADLMV